MLKDNIKIMRKQKGLSQEELAVKLHVVRQTISKWEKGLSVPDVEMVLVLSKVLDSNVSTLLGENIIEEKNNELKIISEKLEVINQQLYQQQERKRKRAESILIGLSILIVLVFVLLYFMNSPYLYWQTDDPEYLVLKTVFHSFEWIFVRVAPFVLLGLGIGIIYIRKKGSLHL